MSGVLGVRSEPAAVHWAIVSGSPDDLILDAHGSEVAPGSYSEGESLAWIRQRVLHILDTYRPTKVGIKYPERNAMGANKDATKCRCRVEGVVLEVASTQNLVTVTGALGTFAKLIHSKSPATDLGADDLRGLDWSRFKDKKMREAIYVAASVLTEG
ncbi:MAG: hypothetical protein ABSD98_08045 [Candidatus Korobacteraceae bacterium]|jgi:hypothetical protein